MSQRSSHLEQPTCFCNGLSEPSGYRDQFHDQPIFLCQNCGTLYIASPPSQSELNFYYRGTYSQKRQTYISPAYFEIMRRRALAQARFIGEHIPLAGTRILDFGCGFGDLLDILRQEGAITSGTDYDPACIESINNKGHNTVKIGIFETTQAQQPWDAVCLSHVLEHVPDPENFLKSISRQSRYIFIEVPKYQAARPEQFTDQEGHLWFFSEKGLSSLVTNSGFSIQEIISAGPPMRLFWSDSIMTRLPRRLLRYITGDYFFNRYEKKTPSGIWIRLVAVSNAA